MARIGLKNFRYGLLDEQTETYGGSLQLGKAIDCKVSLDLNSAELYADDGLAESDYSVKKGTVAITIDEDGNPTIPDNIRKRLKEITGQDNIDDLIVTKVIVNGSSRETVIDIDTTKGNLENPCKG